MSRQSISRSDRVAQMTKQEELIAKKKLEILEKQRNAELAKAVAAATNNNNNNNTKSSDLSPNLKHDTVPICTLRNTFNNDGSFLENFKKITEAAKKNDDDGTSDSAVSQDEKNISPKDTSSGNWDENSDKSNFATSSLSSQINNNNNNNNNNPSSSNNSQMNNQQFSFSQISNMCKTTTQATLPPTNLLNQTTATSSSFPSTSSSSNVNSGNQPFFNLNIPPPILSLLRNLPELAPLHSIPAPKPISLNEIPSPKDLDLNAIPKPQLNLDAIKVPECFTMNKKVFSDKQIPTTLVQLVEMVAKHGDACEEQLLLRKNELHASLWFLFEKDSDDYKNYREMVTLYRITDSRKDYSEKYDPAEIYEDKEDESDSDTEYMREAKERNLKNIKRKLTIPQDDSETTDSDMDDCNYYRDKKNNSSTRSSRSEKDSDTDSKLHHLRSKRKKSRWGDKIELKPGLVNYPDSNKTNDDSQSSQTLLKPFGRSDPALLVYVRQNFGTTELCEEDWQKAEEHFKINLLYQDMMRKRQEIDRLATSGIFKYDYDSDEDTTGGTWEHKLRNAEMEATRVWADALNKQSEGKHHIGDFLPPEELKKFMEKYEAKKNNREPDVSDYKEYKLKEDNIGFQMLQKLGWIEGQGLGASGSGIIDPVNKSVQRENNQGLGVESVSPPHQDDTEYEAYRKRMMLAYRFRPNPLNNPRRAYY